MTGHACPFSAGELLALGAIAETRSHQPNPPAGAARLAAKCYEHHHQHQHPAQPSEGEPDDE
ncbi:hypothetical protein [Micropruina sp.]|uniref:hypothetical protein n=1 Tax=Micropruina sp. TaxID=2737536 RepID=UPI0039E6EA93